MQKWEYARLIFDDQKLLYGWVVYLSAPRPEGRFPAAPKTTLPVNTLLTKLGKEGWELVTVESPSPAYFRNYLFKRPLEE
ncbi:MAG: hypothetical protein A2X25_05665 [Chloroflexi bacterium GWB2_49_20]|nr:MAG: hypothetical protein A2X25_05665 [Chloroflexi bacterium GWB2_49_20]OGN77112.1 MAG: hypothetical protein A2X26_06665 [Chloroflexi bacterium GWC2_49_37]OGN83838.1 MAG: hypothetical protein A2X27_02265 [Chloroflexi bacterium GWD2_49_16]